MGFVKEAVMGKERRKFTIGFKQQVVQEIESGLVSKSGACRKYEIADGVVTRWLEKYRTGTLVEKPTTEEKSLRAENERLKVKVGERTMQIDLLKKLETYAQRKRSREYGLYPEIRQAFTMATTDSDHGLLVYPNLVKHREVNGPNEVWVADSTYIRIATCFVYLAIVLDLFSRNVIGWAIAKHLKKELSLEALNMAIETRKPEPGCIHHSDQGVQYACHEYVHTLTAAELQISMSRKGNPYDNAYAESFMKTLKHEEVSLWNYETYADVIERIPYFIEEVYNAKRRHSALGYVPPEEFEQRMMERSNLVCNHPLNAEQKLSS